MRPLLTSWSNDPRVPDLQRNDNDMKRLLTVQDVSCFGKCSLTVALPIVSAMGIECAVLPTAVLSTHTGACFEGFTFRDLSDDIEAISDHWNKLGLHFDTLTSGYLSPRQVPLVADLFHRFSDGALRIIDPVMGDHGQFYPGFDRDFAAQMASLCRGADYIIPNPTELELLLGRSLELHDPDHVNEDTLKELLPRLSEALGCKHIVVTGVRPNADLQGALAYSAETGGFCSAYNRHVEGRFHGTGDIFTAVFSGALTKGYDLQKSLQTAVDFTLASIEATLGDSNHYYGVKFEAVLDRLIETAH